MKQLKKKTHALALVALGICLASCVSSQNKWTPEPWVGDPDSKSLVKYTGETISCESPKFAEMTAFAPDNISALKTVLSSSGLKKSAQNMVQNSFSILEKRASRARAVNFTRSLTR